MAENGPHPVEALDAPTRILGVDFTSAPSRRKPITVARGTARRGVLSITTVEALVAIDAFEALLREKGPWVGGFDFPFGLPRPFLESGDALPRTWTTSMEWLASTSRTELRDRFRSYCAARPPGQKFAHRAADLAARSSPSMKWVNPPVAFMLKEGAPRLLVAGVHLPGVHEGDRSRIALEAYPAYAARTVVRNASYKSDDRRKWTADRRERRESIVEALEDGQVMEIRTRLEAGVRTAAIEDGSGDLLDAILCAVQAAFGAKARRHGLPAEVDPLEGWIVGVPSP